MCGPPSAFELQGCCISMSTEMRSGASSAERGKCEKPLYAQDGSHLLEQVAEELPTPLKQGLVWRQLMQPPC